MPAHSEYHAIIIGAGLAGLAAALPLHRAGKKVLILEKSDSIGGRLKTDCFEGYLLDHGFQVMLTAYPECQSLLDYDALQLGRFEPGALLWNGQTFETVADPFRQPHLALKTISSSAGTFADKLRIARLALELAGKPISEVYQTPETSASESLRRRGFSSSMIDGFLKPFFSGIFLETELATSNRMLDFVFKCFGSGHAALPAKGMAAIPEQLAAQLPESNILLNQEVVSVSKDSVQTRSGVSYQADHVILATDMSGAAALDPEVSDRGWNATQCFYFGAPISPLPRPMIALNASGGGVIQNLCVPSDINSSYAPAGQSLVCVSTRADTETSPPELLTELAEWFGHSAESFTFLKSYTIPQALPRQLPGDLAFANAPLRSETGAWLCGDYRYSSSIEGALASGRRVAEAILHA